MIRLDKYLSHETGLTRTEVKHLLRTGTVTVDGEVEKQADRKIDENANVVTVSGKPLRLEAGALWYMLHKCSGVVTADTDRHDRTVMDLLGSDNRKTLHPVGRLDKDTEGLLLITDDGQRAHELLSPRKHVDKVYQALVNGFLDEQAVKRFAEGLEIGQGERSEPSVLRLLEDDSFAVPEAVMSGRDGQAVTYTEVTIHEGRFHQVKRMFHAVGAQVIYLRRIAMGPIRLDETLAPGQYRRLTDEEMRLLYHSNAACSRRKDIDHG